MQNGPAQEPSRFTSLESLLDRGYREIAGQMRRGLSETDRSFVTNLVDEHFDRIAELFRAGAPVQRGKSPSNPGN